MTLREQIISAAMELGFSKVGIASLKMPVPDELLSSWLTRNYQADMAWMEAYQEKRLDPRLLMDGAKSILCVAVNYYNPPETSFSGEKNSARFSRYVLGKDYHLVLKERLHRLLEKIHSLTPQAEGRVFVDTGPVMEKYWAQQAGIGWLGKNGNLITKEYGSWVFLGEILLNIELEPDQPHPDHCGTCTRCFQACPTNAIVEPSVVDSRKCISYWTIEYRGKTFPGKIRENLNGWVYGCDICQEVCPWNIRFSRETTVDEFRTRDEVFSQPLEVMKDWSQEEYRHLFSKSAIKRVKYAGLLRNLGMIKKKES